MDPKEGIFSNTLSYVAKVEKERTPQEKYHTPQKSNFWGKTMLIKKHSLPP